MIWARLSDAGRTAMTGSLNSPKPLTDPGGNQNMSFKHVILGLAALAALGATPVQAQQKVDANIIYGAPSSTSWPFWLAKEGGYFEKYGINAKVDFGMHP